MTDSPAIRLVFFGTPQYAVPCLEALHADRRFEVLIVVTQPDRPSGRGHKLISLPVKASARHHGIPVIQPETLRDESVRDHLRSFDADLFVVAAYGLLLSQAVLDIPRAGCVNLHASLLPHYRGAAPINAAILNGDTETGMTLMVMERGLDTGPIIAAERIGIGPEDTTESLTASLAEVGAELALETFPDFAAGAIVPQSQPEGATVVRRLTKADGQIDWNQRAEYIERQVRAMWPWPRAWTSLNGETVQIHASRVAGLDLDLRPGAIAIHDGHQMLVGCGAGVLLVVSAQSAGGKPLFGADLVRHYKRHSGMVFDEASALEIPFIRPG